MQRLIFELIQHTPIIHFQAKDMGATLRASEVKPKLDRYLMKQFEKEDLDTSLIEKWRIPGQEALNYKLSFSLKESSLVEHYLPAHNINENRKGELYKKREELKGIKILSPSPFFANEEKLKNGEKKGSELRLAIRCKENIEGEIFSKYQDLCDKIKSHLEDFFLLHNFGMRQTKGFGSYTISSISGIRIGDSQKYISQKMIDIGVLFCLKRKSDNLSFQFRQIVNFHRKIKTGKRKTISELRRYFLAKRIEWEKILELKIIDSRQKQGGIRQNFSVRYIRALLGLHEHFEFPNKKLIRVSHDNIKRFASPITYKPIGGVVYIILSEIPYEMFDAEFTFSSDSANKQTIHTPKDFDLSAFLGFIKDEELIDVKKLL